METNMKISIRRILNVHETLSKSLQRNSPQLEQGISELSKLSGINEQFIRLHIEQIRNWI